MGARRAQTLRPEEEALGPVVAATVADQGQV